MVDDDVGHDGVPVLRQGRDVIPGTQPRIDRSVVLRIESGVGAVEWQIEGKDVYPPEQARERAGHYLPQAPEITPEPRRIGDQFDLSGHLGLLTGLDTLSADKGGADDLAAVLRSAGRLGDDPVDEAVVGVAGTWHHHHLGRFVRVACFSSRCSG